MRKIIFVGVIVLALATTAVMAQQASEKESGSQMHGMMQGMMGEQKSGEGGMQGMGGMMGMMKMMDQCHAMMAAHKTRDADSAFDILKKRYAKGEIGKADFEKIKKDIE